LVVHSVIFSSAPRLCHSRRKPSSARVLARDPVDRAISGPVISLGYELTGDSLMPMPVSQTCRPPPVPRQRRHAAFHAVQVVAPRFVHKSVHSRAIQSLLASGSIQVPRTSARHAKPPQVAGRTAFGGWSPRGTKNNAVGGDPMRDGSGATAAIWLRWKRFRGRLEVSVVVLWICCHTSHDRRASGSAR
jgi:hypothetical protein